MSCHFHFTGSLESVTLRFNTLTRRLHLPRIVFGSNPKTNLFDFYRQCTYFASKSRSAWITKLHLNETGIIIVFQAPGVVLKLQYHFARQDAYFDLRLKPHTAEEIWDAFSLNLYNNLNGPNERSWLFRRIRRYTPSWYAEYADTWLPSVYSPAQCRLVA